MIRATCFGAGRHRSSARGAAWMTWPSVVHHDVVGQPVRLREVVRHEHGRRAPVARIARSSSRRARRAAVEGRERLVEEQDRGVDGEGASERDALALASRELAREPLLEPAQPETPEDVGGAGPPLRARPVPQPEGDVLEHAEVGEERVALEDVPDPTRLGGSSTSLAESKSTRPSTTIRPASGRTRPARHWSVSVLPAPEGPKSTATPPSASQPTSSRKPGSCLTTRTSRRALIRPWRPAGSRPG